MEKRNKKNVLFFLLISVVYIVAGIIMATNTAHMSTLICYVFGGLLCLNGLIKLIDFLSESGKKTMLNTDIAFSTVNLVLGLYMIFRPELFSTLVPLLYGLVLILNGALNLQQCAYLLKMKHKSWYLQLLMGVLGFVFGIYILTRSIHDVESLTAAVGIFIILLGVVGIIISYMMFRDGSNTDKSKLAKFKGDTEEIQVRID